jgi:hypothetical protein
MSCFISLAGRVYNERYSVNCQSMREYLLQCGKRDWLYPSCDP